MIAVCKPAFGSPCNAPGCDNPATTCVGFDHSEMCYYCGGEVAVCDEHKGLLGNEMLHIAAQLLGLTRSEGEA